MLTQEQINALRAPFPLEALSADTSRGFELTSIKAAFVVERLNQVFGPCGCGWRYVHSPFEFLEGEVLTEVALQFRVQEDGVDPIFWDTQAHNWTFLPDSGAWSYPLLAVGGKRPGKGSAPITDARKSAVTDGLTKAASMIGVGHQVFKGQVRLSQGAQRAPARVQAPRATQPSRREDKAPQNGSASPGKATGSAPAVKANGKAPQRPATPPRQAPSNGQATDRVRGATATTFWSKAKQHAGLVDHAVAAELAKGVTNGTMTWLEAENLLDDMIDDASMPAIESRPVNGAPKAVDPLDDLFAQHAGA